MNMKTLGGFGMMFTLGLVLVVCQDTNSREENEQLKAHVLQLQKDAGELGNRIDVLTKQNADLKAEVEHLKKKHPVKKTPKSKARRSTSKGEPSSQN
jgi:cell division protein FtsB